MENPNLRCGGPPIRTALGTLGTEPVTRQPVIFNTSLAIVFEKRLPFRGNRGPIGIISIGLFMTGPIRSKGFVLVRREPGLIHCSKQPDLRSL